MRLIAILLTIAVLSAGQALGEIEVFFGEDLGQTNEHPNADEARDQFLLSLAEFSIEGFETFPIGTTGTLQLDFGPYGEATLIGDGCAVTGGDAAGAYASSGDQFWFSALAVGYTVVPFTIVFDEPQRAIGFFASDVGDYGAQVELMIDGQRSVAIPATSYAPSGSFLFFGIICEDEPFSTVLFNPGLNYDGVGYDDIIIGSTQTPIENQLKSWGQVKALYR
jgi:hypothetical protein